MNKLIALIIDTLFPNYCLFCDSQGATICSSCLNSLAWPKKKKNRWIYSLGNYKDPLLNKMIHHIKNNPDSELITILVTQFTSYFANSPKESWIILPVPITKKRFRERGFNQAELIARAFSRCLTLTCLTNILIKTKNIKKQGTLANPEDRFTNTLGAFSVSRDLPSKNIIIVDDVTTSGATLSEIRTTLFKAGAKRVLALTLAN